MELYSEQAHVDLHYEQLLVDVGNGPTHIAIPGHILNRACGSHRLLKVFSLEILNAALSSNLV